MTGRAPALAAGAAVVILALVLLAPRLTEKGPDMDEGAVLAYADLVLDGSVPHRDFSTFYGPGSPWLVAGAFAVFGADIATERAVGLAYRLLIVLGVLVLGLRLAGLPGAAVSGVTATLLLTHDPVWAYAAYGALAFAVIGLALASSCVVQRPGGGRNLVALAAGASAGAAVLVRFDVASAVVISALPLVALLPRRERAWYAGGLLTTLAVYVPYLGVVGPEKIARVAQDLVASGPARRVPLPSPWSAPGYLLYAGLLAAVALVVLGAVAVRRDRHGLAGPVMLAGGLLGIGLAPYALSRPDLAHVLPFAIVPLGLAPAAALFWARVVWPGPAARRVSTAAIAVTAVGLAILAGDPELRRPGEPQRLENAGRSFYVDDDSLPARAVIREADRRSRAGDSLFVGPQDLRLADYNPTYVYYLLPDLVPASYYLEMNPDTANREGSGLADELREADWLILTTEFQGEDWLGDREPVLGPDEPNDVVRDLFCLRLESGQYRLYERCDRAA